MVTTNELMHSKNWLQSRRYFLIVGHEVMRANVGTSFGYFLWNPTALLIQLTSKHIENYFLIIGKLWITLNGHIFRWEIVGRRKIVLAQTKNRKLWWWRRRCSSFLSPTTLSHVLAHANTRTRKHTHTHAHTHTRVHTHTHAHTHTRACTHARTSCSPSRWSRSEIPETATKEEKMTKDGRRNYSGQENM